MVAWIGKILKGEYCIGDQLADIEISNQPLVVLSYAKTIHENEQTDYSFRPNGRKDYQLLYIKKGQIEVLNNEQSKIYGENTLLLIKPGVLQKHRPISTAGKTVCFYVHFSGSDVEKYLNQAEITEPVMQFDEPLGAFEEIINRMEMGRNTHLHQEFCNALLQELFILISIALKQNHSNTNGHFQQILKIMDETCTQKYPIKFYAEQCDFTEAHFIRFFKKAMGIPPHKYLINKQIEKSLPLLLYSKDSIKTISEKLGFSNQHYFSKVFIDRYKMPPSEYRNSQKQKL